MEPILCEKTEESMTKQLRDMGGLDVEVESKRLSEAQNSS